VRARRFICGAVCCARAVLGFHLCLRARALAGIDGLPNFAPSCNSNDAAMRYKSRPIPLHVRIAPFTPFTP
jgi:hypothetical protein